MKQEAQILFKHIESKLTLTRTQRESIFDFFSSKQLKRKQFLLREGECCKEIAFVVSGLLKSYLIDNKGVEHVSLFASEGWWISDLHSFVYADKAVLNIDAIEDAKVLLLSRTDYEKLLEEVPVMERYFRVLFQNSLAIKDQRLLGAIADTAEEKYRRFLENYPEVARRIPQHLIASFLGLSAETISRVKRKMVSNKT